MSIRKIINNNKESIKDLLVIFLISVLVVTIVWLGVDAITNRPSVGFDSAMIIQPDNTLVIGDLTACHSTDGRMYKIRMSNGKTYLVPFTRLTLVKTN